MATAIISDPERALDALTREELGLNPEDLGSPWGAAAFSFLSFAAGAIVPLVPFLLDGVFANQAMLQPDFAHPNAAGAAQIARTIWPYLQPLAATLLSRQ